MSVRYLRLDEVLRIHELLMLVERQTAVLIDREKLSSALLRPSAAAFGSEFYPSLAEKAAALLQGIVIAHPFVDGNKRAGLGALLAFLMANGVPLSADEELLYDLVLAVTTGQLREVEDIADQIQRIFTPHLGA